MKNDLISESDVFTDWENFDDYALTYNLEDCGMSGRYPTYHWFYDNKARVNVYVK